MGRAALEDSLRYAQERETFGQPIWQHQSIGNYLADMATRLQAAMAIALDAVRIHGAAGYSTEFDVERYFRDAPLMIVGEGTNEIQRNVIARQLVKRNSVAP